MILGKRWPVSRFSHENSDLGILGNFSEGLTEEMPENVPFLHSESCHSLPTQPTDTILALNES
jgi:hypothetical protein